MNSQALVDRFCESPRRWLIVTAVTLLVGLAAVLPQVDQYWSLRADEIEMREELAEAGRTAQRLPALRARVEALDKQVDLLEGRTLTGEAVADFRGKLVDWARESGCPVRRIGVGNVRARRWREEDSPLADANDKAGADTPFNLETRPVSLSVTGSISEIRALLTRIEKHELMMHTKTIELRRIGRSRTTVQLDLELWCFALSRSKGKA